MACGGSAVLEVGKSEFVWENKVFQLSENKENSQTQIKIIPRAT